ncbi:16S rRNA (cytosine(1402)-N(4))-methyltransferase RsmH [Schaalia sp. 19OD2882]|uniref:16S rRNA (cytosine(1402)-N(4))-methyltransferase RsmH n=1 Tax=Schaalia sp. 19OD2882 TaxID=2794089 RepID=UPI001C1E8E4E|nr:16S rRNA (cytosine(1402)-N(4))-methyltransferase RsmH [Schaalia sp. 19OD2882]QWW18947.1 16S rRNA (cytosine(1402)-N(4))-methyltransferase RsmH [Schaalia sp. 19OD2882]
MEDTRNTAALHVPVLLDECLDMLAPALDIPGAVLVDATLGMGGHSEGALRRFPDLQVVGIDRDPQAIDSAVRRLAPFGTRFRAVHTTYDHLDEVAAVHGRDALVDGVLMDLGVSSLQLDQADRGFSYAKDAPLDMRMDPSTGASAADLLRTLDAGELTRILRTYGEERFAQRIARRIVEQRARTPLTRTGQLVDIVRESIPAPARRTGGNPAKRTFQALRVAVNDELRILERAVPRALASLRVGGRLVVESYQSLEDRIVKDVLRQGSENRAPAGLPVIPADMQPRLRLLTRGAGRAHEAELARNPRSASVRLRGAEVLRAWKECP